MERFAEQSAAAAALAQTPGGRAMLEAVGGGSPFLSDLCVREHLATVAVAVNGPDSVVREAMAALASVPASAPRATVGAALRRAKRVVSLAAALADIGGAWTLAEVTGALSALAEACLRLAVDHLLLEAHAAGRLRLPDPGDPGRGSGFIVLGMGKLGARELNYSSDIDLVLLYDPALHPEGGDALGATFTRIARTLVTLMETRDAGGYVFRTDLRLRPDPAATPPAMALPAAITYYESLGQTWERAAMSKARPVAGDLQAGHGFLQAIRPFVWRRHLDFAAVADLHAMKRRIDAHRGFAPGAPNEWAGFNVKLGPGGIREIEFAAQTLQLVWGGRDPGLRNPTTLGALRGLERAGHIGRRQRAELVAAYRVLRRVEHRLQMVADRQTHSLPDEPGELERFARFLGCDGAEALAALLVRQTARVRASYEAVFGNVPEPPSGAPALDLSGPDLPEATAAWLRELGFRNIPGMASAMQGWRSGRVRALRSARSRELMGTVLPPLLQALAAQADPDAAFMRFDAMLGRQPAGVQLLSTMQRNPALLERVAAVLGAAPSLADHLAGVPSALEGLLAPAAAQATPPARLLAGRLCEARSLEDVIAITSQLVRAEEFRLCCAQLEGAMDVDAAGEARTALADAALQALLPAVLRDTERRHGRVEGGDMAVVALGKAGSGEMMAGSDLDLMLLYAHPAEVAESSGGPPGARHLPASQWFIRAAHAFVAALTAPGAEGPLYAVDMRLRPSGNKGPVAVPLPGFVRYHAGEAWTWERMALTRARVVAGGPAIRAEAEAAVAAALRQPADPARLRADAADMRARLLRELPPAGPWDVKMRAGGGMEVEFVAQVLQLAAGPEPGWQNTGRALLGLAAKGVLPDDEAEALRRADLLWRTVQGTLRITVGRNAAGVPPPAAEVVLRAAQKVPGVEALDLPALHGSMDRTAQTVRRVFTERVGPVA